MKAAATSIISLVSLFSSPAWLHRSTHLGCILSHTQNYFDLAIRRAGTLTADMHKKVVGDIVVLEGHRQQLLVCRCSGEKICCSYQVAAGWRLSVR